MSKRFRGILLCLMMAALALLMCACGPEADTTDEIYGVNVEVPFNTTGPLTTPATIQIQGWFNESVTLSESEYSILTREPVSIGEDVRALQNRLIELGYLSDEKNTTTGSYKRANGRFDAATEQAVEKFEAAYGQPLTGIATEIMQYYLFSGDAKPYNSYTANVTPTPGPTHAYTTTSYRSLQRGDSGEDVKALQQRLYELGYLNYVSGEYDTATETAVKQFASAYGQDTNGFATVDLQKALFASNAKTYQQMLASITPTPTASPTPNPLSAYTDLKSGDSGSTVTRLQQRLRELGYMHSAADGKYGTNTVNAVKKFEAAYGREQTGIATAALQYVLFSDEALPYGSQTTLPTVTPSPTPTVYISYNTLQKGSSGDEVYALQLRLIELGYLSGGADGMYGSMTEQAVMAFEQAYGSYPTGVATALLQQYLFSDGARYNPNVTPTPTAVLGYQELSLGSSGQAVSDLQGRLMELGYYNNAITGYYDSATENAIRLFELAYGRSQTGVATSALQSILFSSSAKSNITPTPTVYYNSLEKGDKGDEVTRLQNRLVELGYLRGTVDGYFGEGTELAVKYFEAAYGHAQTGVATSELLSYLYSSSARSNTSGNVAVSYSTLKSGDSGSAVRELQNRLISLGYLSGSATGTYDAGTANAIKSFQKLMGLSVTGIASSDLQQKLFSSSAKNYSNEKVVSVNKAAVVSASSTDVYLSFYDSAPFTSISKGTQLTVLRTRGIWAEVRSSSGTVGYVMLSDLSYTSSATPTPSLTTSKTSVNKTAYISQNTVTVYSSASTSSTKLGTLNKGQEVVWVSTSGDWAEIRNSSGSVVGYVKTSQLTLTNPSSSSTQSSSNGYSTLKHGSTGQEVKNLQARLKELGYHYGDVGGNYLDRTTNAVKAFQGAIGITDDGVSTPGLQDIIFSPYAPKYKVYSVTHKSYTDMYAGRSDSQVKEFQNLLVSLGYLSKASGTYDSATVKAVQSIQKLMQLKDQSGYATKELQAFLFKCSQELKN